MSYSPSDDPQNWSNPWTVQGIPGQLAIMPECEGMASIAHLEVKNVFAIITLQQVKVSSPGAHYISQQKLYFDLATLYQRNAHFLQNVTASLPLWSFRVVGRTAASCW